jgi:RNA polymerase sigma-70 factor, ECF subfamily
VGQVEQGAQRRAFFATLQLADVVPMISGGVCERILGISSLLAQLPKDNTESDLWSTYSPTTAVLPRHHQDILLLTTIVRPTYSVYSCHRRESTTSKGDTVSSSLTIRIPSLSGSSKTATEPTDSVAVEVEASDEVLVALVSENSKEALALLFRRYARLVRGVAYRVLQNASEADDLLQDVFLLLHRLCGTFDSSKGSARFWILQMTYRRAISRRRYLISRHFYQSVDIDEVAETLKDIRSEIDRVANSLAGLLGAGKLEQAFETLSEGQRQTIWLHFFEGYTLDEIASKLGQSRGNIKHHYFRGLERLRKQVFGGKL